MDTFNTYNAYTCLVMGLSSNLTLAWLILKATKVEMKHYSTILLHSIVVNIAYLVVSAIVQPYALFEDGNLLMVQTGFSHHSSRIVSTTLFMLWLFILLVNNYSLSSQFVYRYLILCRKKEVTSRLLAIILLIPNIFCVILIILSILGNEAFDGHDALIESIFHINATKYSFGFFVRKVMNPLCTLLIVKRYRKQIVSLFKCHQESPSITVSKATTVVVKR